MRQIALAFAVLAVSAAPGQTPAQTSVSAPNLQEMFEKDWRRFVTPADMSKLINWRKTFAAALASANKDGASDSVTREGPLLDPDAALEHPAIPAGAYRCRTIKLGRKGAYTSGFSERPASRCTVSDASGQMRFATLDGSQRPAGRVFPGNVWQQIFLGTMTLGDETRAMAYGRDATRDVAGAIERIGERRWRLLLPQPGFESLMAVVELTPAD